jgi:hypothetical protein
MSIRQLSSNEMQVRRAADGKYELVANGEVIGISKDFGYFRYLQIKDKIPKRMKDKGMTLDTEITFAFELPVKKPKPERGSVNREEFVGPPAPHDPYKRPRGRPRKYVTYVDGQRVFKISDEEPPLRLITHQERLRIELNFLKLVEDGVSLQDTLKFIAKNHYLPYKQAHTVCSSLM